MKRAVALFFSLLWLFLPGPIESREETARELFAKAYALYSQGKFSDAEGLFLKTLEEDYLLTDYSLYFLSEIAFSRGAWDSARSYAARLTEKFPQSTRFSHAALTIAKISLAEKNYPQALRQFQALQKRSAESEISNEALYHLGRIHEIQGDLKQAHSFYQTLRRSSPLSPWATRARTEVNKLREQNPQLFGLDSPGRMWEEGELLVRERQHREAERIYRKLLDSAPFENARARVLTGLAHVYRSSRQRDDEIRVLAEIVQKYPHSPQAAEALYRLARAHWNRNENLLALELLRQLKERHPESAFVEYAEFISGRIQESLGKTEEAVSLYQNLVKRFPESRLREDAEWQLAWIYYLRSDHRQARILFKRIAEAGAGGSRKNAALYWLARTTEKMGYTEEAQRLYLKLTEDGEESYYSGPAAKRLESKGVVQQKQTAPSDSLPDPDSTPISSHVSFHLSRARELAEISLSRLAVAELHRIENHASTDLNLGRILMGEYARNGAYDRSIALANQLDLSSAEVARHRYPLAYWELIQKQAEHNDLDPYLVLALIRQESLFEPRALSPASAYGLMQLLPSTAARVAKQLGLPPPQTEQLFNPDINITVGTGHLKELLKLYGGNLVKALAAYNAGEEALARWSREISAEDEEEFIERISFGETRLYVKLVLRNHLRYRSLYKNQK